MTAYSGLFWSGHLEDNETVLVHAVSDLHIAHRYFL